MKQTKYTVLAVVFILLFSFCSKQKRPQDETKKKAPVIKKVPKKVNRIILEINDAVYRESDLKSYMTLHLKSFSELKRNSKIQSYIFEKFIIQKMILYKAGLDKYGFDETLLKSKVRSRIGDIKKEEIQEYLNEEKVKHYIESVLYRDISVTDREISRYYMDNKDKYRKKSEVHLFEIMLNDRKKANEIRAILNTAPGRFSEFARKESVSKVAKEDGSLGFIEIDTLPESFRKFIRSVPINKVTPVVELLYGNINGKNVFTYHIFKVTKRKRKRLLFLSKVKESIRSELILQKKETRYEGFIRDLNNSLRMKIKLENLFFKYKKT